MNTFLIADTHFGHANMNTFVRDDGTPLRPFQNVEEMNEEMVQRWNAVVSPRDKVYHLGDVAIPRSGLQYLERLNGRKVLIKGNHDIFKAQDYLRPFRFDDIRGSHKLDAFILSHIPIHPAHLDRYKGNIHGHTHYRRVQNEDESNDERYQCVCVEHTNYAPVPLDVVLKKFRDAGIA